MSYWKSIQNQYDATTARGNDPVDLPDGTYQVQIEGDFCGETKRDGTPYMSIFMRVLNGTLQGAVTSKIWVFNSEPKNLARMKADFELLGLNEHSLYDIWSKDEVRDTLGGKCLTIKVSNGKKYTFVNILNIITSGVTEPTSAEPDVPDDVPPPDDNDFPF